jgi:hypothetical protein
MRNLYEIGRVYVWQNQRWPYESLNGVETTVTGDIEHCEVTGRSGQQTATIWQSSGSPLIAEAGDLRVKNPPPGELSILDQFKSLEPVAA